MMILENEIPSILDTFQNARNLVDKSIKKSLKIVKRSVKIKSFFLIKNLLFLYSNGLNCGLSLVNGEHSTWDNSIYLKFGYIFCYRIYWF